MFTRKFFRAHLRNNYAIAFGLLLLFVYFSGLQLIFATALTQNTNEIIQTNPYSHIHIHYTDYDSPLGSSRLNDFRDICNDINLNLNDTIISYSTSVLHLKVQTSNTSFEWVKIRFFSSSLESALNLSFSGNVGFISPSFSKEMGMSNNSNCTFFSIGLSPDYNPILSQNITLNISVSENYTDSAYKLSEILMINYNPNEIYVPLSIVNDTTWMENRIYSVHYLIRFSNLHYSVNDQFNELLEQVSSLTDFVFNKFMPIVSDQFIGVSIQLNYYQSLDHSLTEFYKWFLIYEGILLLISIPLIVATSIFLAQNSSSLREKWLNYIKNLKMRGESPWKVWFQVFKLDLVTTISAVCFFIILYSIICLIFFQSYLYFLRFISTFMILGVLLILSFQGKKISKVVKEEFQTEIIEEKQIKKVVSSNKILDRNNLIIFISGIVVYTVFEILSQFLISSNPYFYSSHIAIFHLIKTLTTLILVIAFLTYFSKRLVFIILEKSSSYLQKWLPEIAIINRFVKLIFQKRKSLIMFIILLMSFLSFSLLLIDTMNNARDNSLLVSYPTSVVIRVVKPTLGKNISQYEEVSSWIPVLTENIWIRGESTKLLYLDINRFTDFIPQLSSKHFKYQTNDEVFQSLKNDNNCIISAVLANKVNFDKGDTFYGTYIFNDEIINLSPEIIDLGNRKIPVIDSPVPGGYWLALSYSAQFNESYFLDQSNLWFFNLYPEVSIDSFCENITKTFNILQSNIFKARSNDIVNSLNLNLKGRPILTYIYSFFIIQTFVGTIIILNQSRNNFKLTEDILYSRGNKPRKIRLSLFVLLFASILVIEIISIVFGIGFGILVIYSVIDRSSYQYLFLHLSSNAVIILIVTPILTAFGMYCYLVWSLKYKLPQNLKKVSIRNLEIQK